MKSFAVVGVARVHNHSKTLDFLYSHQVYSLLDDILTI